MTKSRDVLASHTVIGQQASTSMGFRMSDMIGPRFGIRDRVVLETSAKPLKAPNNPRLIQRSSAGGGGLVYCLPFHYQVSTFQC